MFVAVPCTMHLELLVTEDVKPTWNVESPNDCSLCLQELSVRERRQKDKEERLSLVLWRRPVITLHYFVLETLIKLKEWTFK